MQGTDKGFHMNSRGFGWRGWITHLVAAISLVVLMSGMAAAATVSGTVTNSSTKTGRVYLLVLQQMGGTTSSGVSVGPLAPGDSTSYTINGVPDGNFFMFAPDVWGSSRKRPHGHVV